MYVVGLTGGIGSGKTTASDMFASLGVTIVDADVISREITASGGCAVESVRQMFGDEAVNPDGSMNRKYVRELVFGDPAQRLRLEGLLHPIIQERSLELLSTSQSPYSILSVPLLTEKGFWKSRINRLLVIDVAEEQQIRRVMARSGLPAEDVARIIMAQTPRMTRLSMADDVIVNCSSLDRLSQSVSRLHALYTELSKISSR